jgi:2-dehydropantoate 2-reductase
MRMLVVGAGSTGGFFGGRLAQAGRDVTFLVRPRRAAQLRERGLEIASPHGDAVVRPQLIAADEIRGTFDVVLLTVKAFTLDAAIEDMAPAVGSGTMIIPVLNGMHHLDVLAARFGRAAVLGGAAKVAATLDADGRIVQLAPFQDLAYGELDGQRSARVLELDRFMQGAGFDARLSPQIMQEMWDKWALLATLGGVTCLMRGNVGEIGAAPGGAEFLLRFLGEVVAVIDAVGLPVSEATVAQAKAVLAVPRSPLTSSMYRDLEQHAPIEAEQIIGDLLARGRAAGLATPLLAAAHTHLGVYQKRLAPAGRSAAAEGAPRG